VNLKILFLCCHLFLTYFFSFFNRDDSGYLTIKPKKYDASPKEDDELNGSGLEGMAVGMPTKKTSRKEPLDWIEEITVVVEDNAVSPTSAANGMPVRFCFSINP